MSRTLLQNKRVIVVIHESVVGPGHDLRDYLLHEGASEVLFIAHPLLYLKEYFKSSSRLELYKYGKLAKEITAHHWKGPEIFLYFKDALYTVFWCIKYGNRFDIYIGLDNLNAFVGLMLRAAGAVRSSIFYAIDYVPNRFKNPVLNIIYHFIEKLAAAYSDWTWNLSPRMIETRQRRWNAKFPHQLVVPHGIHFGRIHRVPFSQVHEKEIIFMGALLEKQGVQMVIRTLPKLIQSVPGCRFTVIGKGPYEKDLKRLTAKLHLGKHVDFLGHISNPQKMENRLAQASVAVALYKPTPDDFSYYTDSGKVKNYLGAGVPVVLTDVPFVAGEIKKARCGFISSYSEESLLRILKKYLTNTKMQQEYRKNAAKFARRYMWNSIFSDALQHAL